MYGTVERPKKIRNSQAKSPKNPTHKISKEMAAAPVRVAKSDLCGSLGIFATESVPCHTLLVEEAPLVAFDVDVATVCIPMHLLKILLHFANAPPRLPRVLFFPLPLVLRGNRYCSWTRPRR